MEGMEQTSVDTGFTTRRYEGLRMELVCFAQEDIVRTSGETDDKGEGDFF